LFSRFFNHVGVARAAVGMAGWTATLTFFARERFATSNVLDGHDMNPGSAPMPFMSPFVSRLSVVTAYVALAFVGAIILGVF
jgi:hypothetical protein